MHRWFPAVPNSLRQIRAETDKAAVTFTEHKLPGSGTCKACHIVHNIASRFREWLKRGKKMHKDVVWGLR